LIGGTAVKAEPAVGVAVSAPINAATLGTAAVATVLANEAFAKKPFGNNGEGMKVLHGAGKIVKHWFPHW
jgi:hypothetical protein